jgi:hypothetical protein
MRRNIRFHVALLFAVIGLSLCGYGAWKLDQLPVYSDKDLDLAAELNLSLDLARRPADQQPKPDEIGALRAQVRAEVGESIQRERDLIQSWIQTGMVLIGMGILQALLQRLMPLPAARR